LATIYKELIRQVMLKLVPRVDGITRLTVEQAINDAQKIIAEIKDFDELRTLDITHAFTVINKKLYHIETDLLLVRPKDIYSIRYMDAGNSRKLTFTPLVHLDELIPYTEIFSTGRPSFYVIRGRYIELFRIPNEAKPLYIQHSQWPTILVNDTDATDYLNIDHVIVGLATEMSIASLEGSSGDWAARAKALLGTAVNEEETRPDQTYVAQPFNPTRVGPLGDYWLSPWIKH